MWKLWKCINLYRVQEGALSYSCYFVSSKKRKEKKQNKCIGKLKMLEVLFWKVLWRGSSFSWILTKTRDTESIGGAFHECTLESCQYFVIRCCHQQVAGCCPSVNTFFFPRPAITELHLRTQGSQGRMNLSKLWLFENACFAGGWVESIQRRG